jgi:hypothetical protein
VTGNGAESREAEKAFQVFIDDNYHFMDEDKRTTGPTFATYGEAVAWCQTYLERHLQELAKPGMSAADLIAGYKSFGDDPWITPEPEGTHFSAWDFVEEVAGRVARPAESERTDVPHGKPT